MANTQITIPQGTFVLAEPTLVQCGYFGPEANGYVEVDERWAVILPASTEQELDDTIHDRPVWWRLSGETASTPIFRADENTYPPSDDPDFAWFWEMWKLDDDGHWTRADVH